MKSYSKFEASKIAATIRAAGGPNGGGGENLIMEDAKIYDSNPTDSRIKGPLPRSPAVTARMGTGGNQGPLVEEPICVHTASTGAHGRCYKEGGTPALNTVENYGVAVHKVVRRLTPLECERLQGLPDGWTKGGKDTARYKAIGNGMAQPCADFVMEKVVEAIRREK